MPKKTRTTSLENIFVSETHRLIYTEISYLKKRIHLVEGERKANFESNEETLKKNEVRVKELKKSNEQLKKRRKRMIESKEAFVKQIAERLGGEKKAYEFKDKKFSDVLDILECKIGTLRNKQNALSYKKNQQQQQMETVVVEEQDLQNAIEGKESKAEKLTATVQRRLDEIKGTETATAAMLMKITEADNIRSRYKNMISLVKSENFSLNLKVSEHDRGLESEHAEIERIRTVLQDSLKAKKQAKSRLAEIEDKTIKDYTEREQHLYESRMQLKIMREKMEQIGSKLSFPKFHMIHRDSSTTDGLYVGYKTTDDGLETKSQSITETVYNNLAKMIGESDPALIVIRFQEQRDHSKELLTQEDLAKSLVRKAKLRKRFLVDKLSQLQYSGGVRREKLNSKYGQIHEEMTTTGSLRDKLSKWLDSHYSAMEQMQSKLIEICQLNDLKTPPLTSDIAAENVAILLKYVLKQLEKILGSQDASLFSPTLLSPAIPPPDFEGGQFSGGLLPLEITTEGPIFNLPSPGSTRSFRIGGSMSDIEQLTLTPGPLGIDPGDKSPFDMSDGGMIQPSIAVTGVLMDKGLQQDEDVLLQRKSPVGGIKIKSGGLRKDSSDEEEAISRNVVKRQSQILYEAKTRKGRFNPQMPNNARPRKY